MIAYKLFRKKKNGKLTSLFINKSKELEFNTWLPAENHKTKGFKERPYWHCTSRPNAPHLSVKNRVWVEVEMLDYEEFVRPKIQGGLWYLSNNIKLLKEL